MKHYLVLMAGKMTKDLVFEKLKIILATQLNVDAIKITPSANIKDDLGADSLDIAEIALLINEQFSYELSDKEFSTMKTVGDLVDVLTSRV